MTQLNPMYAMSNIAMNKSGNDKLIMVSTGLFLGLGALMLVKEIKDLIRDKDTHGHFRDNDHSKSR